MDDPMTPSSQNLGVALRSNGAMAIILLIVLQRKNWGRYV